MNITDKWKDKEKYKEDTEETEDMEIKRSDKEVMRSDREVKRSDKEVMKRCCKIVVTIFLLFNFDLFIPVKQCHSTMYACN